MITYDHTVESWRPKQTKDHIMDQTAEAMRTVMLHDLKYNPLRH